MFPLLITCLFGAQIAFWTEPSLVNAGLERSSFADEIGRVYAARGESESFQVCVRAKRGALENLRIEAEAPEKGVAAPHVYLVLPVETETPSPRMLTKQPWLADALMPAVPIHLDDDKLAVFWLTYDVARDAEPGIRKSALRLLADDVHPKTVEVRIEIFDFALPEIPSFAALFEVDRAAAPPLAEFAKALGPWRVSFGPLELAADRAVLEAGLDEAHWACAEWSLSGATPFDAGDATAFLSAHGGKGRALAKLPLPRNRALWQPLRGELERQPWPLPCLILGPPHPAFTRFADRWAAPAGVYSPELLRRFHRGLSLASPTLPLLSATASSCGETAGQHAVGTLPEDACDGSVFTVWRADKSPKHDAPPWVQFRFAERIPAEAITLWWTPDAPPKEVEILLSNDGALFAPATVDWRRSYDPDVDRTVDAGSFKLGQNCRALRVRILSSGKDTMPGLAEVALLPPNGIPEPQPAQSISPWLSLMSDAFPSLAAGVYPAEARLIPWVCWSRGIHGSIGPVFNRPPRAPENRLPGCGFETLVYIAGETWSPSVRLERLRDGIEDFDYLTKAAAALKSGKLENANISKLLGQPFDNPEPDIKQLDAWRKMLLDTHLKIGRELHAEEKTGE